MKRSTLLSSHNASGSMVEYPQKGVKQGKSNKMRKRDEYAG
jgi:hypothetical protein